MPSVMQPWTYDISMMQQTVLMVALRGPDAVEKYHPAKYLLRWMRRCIVVSALDGKIFTDPYDKSGGSYTGPSYEAAEGEDNWEQRMDYVLSDYIRKCEILAYHFTQHFRHAAEILGYKHPNDRIRTWWLSVYERLVNIEHLHPETEAEMDARLGDNREGWLARNDKATIK